MLRNIIVFSAFIALLFFSESAFAQSALFDSGTNFLQALQDLLTNTWARIIAIIAVVCLGILWMTGRMPWYTAGSVITGIILVFGAPAIVDSVASSI